MPDTPKDDAFLSRWSRLKRAPKTENAVKTPSDPLKITEPRGEITENDLKKLESPDEPSIDDDELSDAELLVKYALPDPDGMKTGDDFSQFMRRAIPDRLRRRALRVLWGSNPLLANLDELVDYGEDYTDAATVIENMQTIYQVGKGSAWKFQAEQARIAEEEAAAAAEEAERRAHNGEPIEPEIALDADEEDLDETEPDPETDPEPDPSLLAAQAEVAPPPLPARPRPMRFEFD